MFPHLKFHKFTATYPDGKAHDQTDHISKGRRRHLGIRDVRSLRVADWVTDHYLVLVVEKVRERLVVCKQRAHIFHMESLNLKKLKHIEGKEQYRLEISNKLSDLENLDYEILLIILGTPLEKI
jgi:hypothetical protein